MEGYHLIRLHMSVGLPAVVSRVLEAEALVVPAGGSHRGEDLGVDRDPGPDHWHHG